MRKLRITMEIEVTDKFYQDEVVNLKKTIVSGEEYRKMIANCKDGIIIHTSKLEDIVENKIMTEKQKAIELVDAYDSSDEEENMRELAMFHAMIDVDNTIEALEHHFWQNRKQIEYYKTMRRHITTFVL